MLATSIISIGIKFRIAIPVQRLCASIKMYSTSSGSSSDSSDSDSDAENVQKVKEHHNKQTSDKSETLNVLIDRLTQNNNTKMMDVALPLRQTKKEKVQMNKNISYEAQLTEAVENVTNVLSGDKESIKSQLLNKLSDIQKGRQNMQKQYGHGHLRKLITNMATENQLALNKKESKRYNVESQEVRKSIIHQLSEQHQKEKQKYTIDNTTNINEQKMRNQGQYQQKGSRLKSQNVDGGNYTIFRNIKEPTTDIPELSTWNSLEQRELALLSNHAPENIFQEMIQWTESGKLWTFPIDNEYGMEEEHNVHFSEHVFLERHLKDWCPKRGPIRHFMELVCVGLSKNPYMTVDEKIGHITWYKEYFKGKEELLQELGAIDAPSNMTEQIKA